MKALSLWQPWACGIAVGTKTYETRSWPTKYRGELAIHAARRPMDALAQQLASTESALGRLPVAKLYGRQSCPLGAIVAVVDVEDCIPTELAYLDVSPIERIWGDYSEGRYAWKFGRIRALRQPIGCTGRQGLFDLPESIERAVRAAIEPKAAS